MLIRTLLLFALLAIGPVGPAAADEFTVSTAESLFNAGRGMFGTDTYNSGWYANGGRIRSSGPSNDNYITGFRTGDGEARGFLTFDLPVVPDPVVSATLDIYIGGVVDELTGETVGIFDVSTPAATLNAKAGENPDIFADLGSGSLYGSVELFRSDSRTRMMIDLSGDAIDDINASLGGFFSVGFALQSIGPSGASQFVFGSSALEVNELILTTIPEPGTAVLLLLGLMPLAARRSSSA